MNYKAMLLLLALGLTAFAATGCPDDDDDDGDTNVVVRDRGEEGSDTIIDHRADTTAPPAGDTNIDINVDTTDDDFSRGVTSRWPEVQVVVDDQVAALNGGVVTTYETTFAPDSPARERMITSFETDNQGRTYMYRLDDFEVLNQTDTEATARVVLLRRDPTVADAMDTRFERTYVLRQDPNAGRWLVYDVQDLGTTEVVRSVSSGAGGSMAGGAGSADGGAGGGAGSNTGNGSGGVGNGSSGAGGSGGGNSGGGGAGGNTGGGTTR